jgi:hypothetical protein
MLSDFDISQIKWALSYAEIKASPAMKSRWVNVLKRFIEEVEPPVSTICQCEDRPCCSCDKDYYRNDNNEAPDYEAIRERSEERELQWEMLLDSPCSICKENFDADEDNEDDIVQGFHADCAADGDHYGDI